MTVDWSINIGNILTIVGFIGGGLFLFAAMRGDISAMAQRLAAVESAVGKLSDILVAMATASTRLDSHAERLERLERLLDGDAPSARSRSRSAGG